MVDRATQNGGRFGQNQGPENGFGPGTGALLICLAMLLFTIMSGLIKATAPDIPAGQAVFFRSVFSVPIILIWLWRTGHLHDGLETQNPWNHALRGVSGACAMGLGFSALAYLPLPEVTAIRFATPIIMVILAALILGERLRLIRITAVVVGLIGVLIILWPRLSGTSDSAQTLGALLTLGSAALAAFAQVSVKRMSGTETTAAIVFYFAVTAASLSLLTLPFGWAWPSATQAFYLIGAGLIGGAGQIFLTASYQYADASALAPFTYSSMIWAILIGWLWFGEWPTLMMLAGATLVIAAGAAIVWRERALGQEATARRKVRSKGMQ